MSEIDIGPGAVNPTSSIGGQDDTWLDLHNPANDSGIIDTVEIWVQTTTDNTKVGMFYNTGGSNYKCRSAATLGPVASGAKRTFTELELTVEAGDVIGVWNDGGAMGQITTGGTHVCRSDDNTDHMTPGDEADYSTGWDDWRLTIYGTGQTLDEAILVGSPVSQAMAEGLI